MSKVVKSDTKEDNVGACYAQIISLSSPAFKLKFTKPYCEALSFSLPVASSSRRIPYTLHFRQESCCRKGKEAITIPYANNRVTGFQPYIT
jgi:hypothetical protein